MDITIDVDEENNRFVLQGNTSKLLGSIRVLRYLKDYLNSDLKSKDCVSIYYDRDDKEDTLIKIKHMLDHFNIKEEYSQNVKTILSDYFQEEENFKEFSKKAYLIRNNDCEVNDFKNFIDVISREIIN